MKINSKKLQNKYLKSLGVKYKVRRYQKSTDTFLDSTEYLVVEPQSITYRPLNRYKKSIVGQPIPVERVKVYSGEPFSDFRDEIILSGDTFRVIEISRRDEILEGLYSTTFVKGTKNNENT